MGPIRRSAALALWTMSTVACTVVGISSVDGRRDGDASLDGEGSDAVWDAGFGACGDGAVGDGGRCDLGCEQQQTVLDVPRVYDLAVPVGCGRVMAALWGAGGGAGGTVAMFPDMLGGEGGGGAYVQLALDLAPSSKLQVVVGAGGHAGALADTCAGGGGGGGASTLFVDGTLRAVAAAGGGGGGAGNNEPGRFGEAGRQLGVDGMLSAGQDGGAGHSTIEGELPCDEGFGGAGGFGGSASGGTGGCEKGGGGGGGGYPGGAGGDYGYCTGKAQESAGGHAGDSYGPEAIYSEAGDGTQPGNDAEANGAGVGGQPDAQTRDGSTGRVVLTWLP